MGRFANGTRSFHPFERTRHSNYPPSTPMPDWLLPTKLPEFRENSRHLNVLVGGPRSYNISEAARAKRRDNLLRTTTEAQRRESARNAACARWAKTTR